MVVGGAGTGEALESGFIQQVRTGTTTDIEFLKTRGLSSQKVAFIESELSARRAEAEGAIVSRLTERESIRAFAEPRTVAGVQEAQLRFFERETARRQQISPVVSTPSVQFQGPTRPTTDIQAFRATGVSKPTAPTQVSELPMVFQKPADPFGIEPSARALPKSDVPFSKVEAVSKPERILGGAEQFLTEKKFTAGRTGALAAEVVLLPVRGFQFIEKAFKEPKETARETGLGTLELGRRVVTGEGIPEIGRALEERPGRLLTFGLVELALFKGTQALPRLALKGTDIARTIRLKELKSTDIIDPKFFSGQTFPTITKGETAGGLLAEFKTILPGEKFRPES